MTWRGHACLPRRESSHPIVLVGQPILAAAAFSRRLRAGGNACPTKAQALEHALQRWGRRFRLPNHLRAEKRPVESVPFPTKPASKAGCSQNWLPHQNCSLQEFGISTQQTRMLEKEHSRLILQVPRNYLPECPRIEKCPAPHVLNSFSGSRATALPRWPPSLTPGPPSPIPRCPRSAARRRSSG